WKHRYFHRYLDPTPYTQSPQRLAATGVNVWNIHHCSDPVAPINYPCWDRSFPVLKHCVQLAHKHDVMVKIYYTTREITHLLPELWAFFSLNGEIIFPGPGPKAISATNPDGAHPWLTEHLREDFIPAWREALGERYQRILSLALVTTPDSRLDNFYLEGLDYIIRNADIDGLYIDGTSLGRKSLQRARRIFEHHKKRFLFDFHEGYGGMHHDKWGRGNPLLRFCDIMPYFDRIWLGEGYSYNDTPPDFWLIEMSGIPFGVMGEMLQGGGNPWLGMVYGMTQRLGTSGNPRNIWKLWDEFSMQGSQMFGYWDPDCPVKADSREVLATAYVKPGKTLIALGNWGAEDTCVRLELNWQKLGLDPAKATLFAPAIDGFQTSAVFRPEDLIPVSSKRGRLIIIDETPPETLRAREQARVEAERPYIGAWEFTYDGVICQRCFNPDHTAELFGNGKRQAAWNGFRWRLEDHQLIVDRPDGSTEEHHLDDQGRLVLPFGLGTARKVRR
ncbi:MAG: glycoside hydrolase domain-containing protein, partial [Planctomycetota bacterium]